MPSTHQPSADLHLSVIFACILFRLDFRCRLDVAHALAPPEDPLGEQQGGDHSTGGGESVGAGVVGPPPTAASSVLGDASYLQRHSCSTGAPSALEEKLAVSTLCNRPHSGLVDGSWCATSGGASSSGTAP